MKSSSRKLILFVALASILVLIGLGYVGKDHILYKLRRNRLTYFHSVKAYDAFFKWHERFFVGHENNEILNILLKVQLETFQIDNAIVTLTKLCSDENMSPKMFDLAMLLHLQGSFLEALQRMQTYLDHSPAEKASVHVEVWKREIGRRYIQLMSGQPAEPVSTLLLLNLKTDLLFERGNNSALLQGFVKNLIGLGCLRMRYKNEAHELLTESLDRIPNAASTFYFLALSDVLSGNLETATYYYALAQKLNKKISLPETLSYRVDVAIENNETKWQLLFAKGQYAEALQVLEHMDTTSSPTLKTTFLMGRCCEEIGDTNKALQYYERTLSLFTKDQTSSTPRYLSTDSYSYLAKFRINVLTDKKDLLDGLRDKAALVIEPPESEVHEPLSALFSDNDSYEFDVIPEKLKVRIGIVCSGSMRENIGPLVYFGLENLEKQPIYIFGKRPELKIFDINLAKYGRAPLRIVFVNDVLLYVDDLSIKEDRNFFLHKIIIFK